MKKLNVIIVGVGHDHAHDAFKYVTDQNSSFNLLGFVLLPKDEVNYAKWKEDYEKYNHYSIEEALNLNNLDAVLIESDDTLLSEYACKFAQKCIPVHMDKPGAQNKAEFDKLFDICKENQSTIHLGYMYRYNPAIQDALRLYKLGAFGKIYYIETSMNITHPDEKKIWLKNFKGGTMNFLGCHLIDVICMFLGKPDSVVPYNVSTKPNFGEDISFAILKYGNTFSTVNSTAVEIDGFSRRHIVIVGEKATIEIAPTEYFMNGGLYTNVKYKTFGNNSLIEPGEKTFGPGHRYRDMFEEFASIVRGECKNPYSYDYEIMVHDTLLAACGEYGKEIKL